MSRKEALKYKLEVVNKWLVFGETKNAAIVAFNSGVAIGIINLVRSANCNLNFYLECYLYVIFAFSLTAATCALISFLPATRIKFHFPADLSEADNIYFFGHLCKYDGRALIEIINKKNKFTDELLVSEEDLANQIITNSKIAMGKYRLFTVALWLTIAAVASPVLALIIYFRTNPKK